MDTGPTHQGFPQHFKLGWMEEEELGRKSVEERWMIRKQVLNRATEQMYKYNTLVFVPICHEMNSKM